LGDGRIGVYDYIYDPESKIMAVTGSKRTARRYPLVAAAIWISSGSFASLMPARFDTFASTMTPLPLAAKRLLLLRAETIVDATIIAAPSSTKNASAARDPETKQTRKGRNWHLA
jgi:hypothetical protein